ncbi:lytic transglycosylase domain-containing protein [Propionivibrio sp.]|uniref:lytic transglycosylase domain-containing protein n=1 Tax=Propionivibrio sp. TaxID=2212460 RepID=UPI0039E6D412
MMTPGILALIQLCAPMVHPTTMAKVVTVESSGNPYAIGVVGGRLARQPRNLAEALATVEALQAAGWNFSVGHAQINKVNFRKYGLNPETAFDPCTNLRVGGLILQSCYVSSLSSAPARNDSQFHLTRALSCYYSGRLDSRDGWHYAGSVFSAGSGNR